MRVSDGAGIGRLSFDTRRVVRDVVRKKSLTQVALDLGISQPAVSFHVKKFESLAERRIIERIGNEMVVASDAAQILALFDEIVRLQAELSAIAGSRAGARNAIGICSDVFSAYTTHRRQALDMMRRYTISTDSAAAVSRRYADNELSAVFRPVSNNESEPELSLEVPMWWAGSAKSAKDDGITAMPIIVEPKSSGNRDSTTRYLKDHVREYTIVAEASTDETFKFLFECALGYALLPAFRIEAMGLKRTDIPDVLQRPFKGRYGLFFNKRRLSLREATDLFDAFAKVLVAR